MIGAITKNNNEITKIIMIKEPLAKYHKIYLGQHSAHDCELIHWSIIWPLTVYTRFSMNGPDNLLQAPT